MLGRLNIRGKIFAVVAVPILVLVIAAITVTANATQTYTAADNSAQLIEVAEVSHNLTTALQTERDAGVNFLHFFRYATDERDTREVDTDAAYQNILTALTSAPADYRDEATSARATLDAILTRYGVDANGNFVDFGSGSDGSYSLAAARAIDVVIEPIMGTDPDGNTIIVGYEDWPVWPDAPTMRRLEDVYSRLEAEVLDLAERTPAGTGMVDEMNRYGQLLGVERTSATSFLTTLETYVVPTGSVSTIIPDFAGTYQDLYLSAQEAVDEGIEELRTALTNLKTNSVNADTRSALVAALDSLATLEERRETVRHQSVGPGALSGWYHTAIGNLISSLYATAGVLPNRGIAEALTAFAEIDTLIEAIRLEEMTGLRIIRQAEFTDSDPRTGYIDLYARTNAALEAAQVAVGRVQGVPELPDFGISFDATDNINWEGIRTRLRNDQVGFVRTLGWSGQIVEEVEEGILPVQNAVWNKANNLASNATRSALAQAILTAVGAAVILGLSLIIAWIIAKRIIDPLRRLTTTATAVRQELPRLVERVALPGQTVDVSEVQIPVESSDEVGRLAEAFNAVNAATLTIAGEQAALRGSISEMFVNVARRDQVLLNRQLASIDEMERSQDDPDTLTRLFALDHLATRMRRNSESLLVLAGIDTGRRMRRPMPLSDVIRTASSEIELYERIQLELDADPSMVGHSALTAGHLFAELLENATVFSDPGTPVVVRTTRKEESVIVEIVDLGIGMTPEELHEANARVRSTAASEILGAQRLGLFVVGRIARRLGARVEIVSEEGKGTTATVTMPLSLFDFTAEPELDRKSESTVDKALHVPTALIGHHGEDEVMDVYSDDVMTPAIAGASYQKPEEVDEEIALLIQEDAELAPETEEVDLTELVEGKTSKGLPARKRRTGAKKEAARDTTSVLGLPETPTSGQLEQMKAGGQGFTPEDAEEASTAEQRSALFRGFRARRTEEGGEIDPNIESLGHVARRDAVTADEPVPLLEEPAPEAEFVPEPEAELAPEFEVESMSEPEAEITWESEAEEEPLPEPEVELALESEPEEEFQLESEAPPEAEISVEPMILEDAEPVAEAVSEASSEEWDITDIGEEDETIPVSLPSDLDVSAVAIPVPEFESAEGTADAWEAASVEPEDVTELTTEGVGEMPAPASEDGPRFSWESVPAADETVPTLEEVLQPKREAAVDEPVEAVPAAGKKPRKDKRGLFGGRKKKEGPAPSAEETPPPVEDGGAIPVTPPSGEVQVAEEGPVEPTGYALEAESSEAEALGTDVATPEQASEVEYDEWGLPVARSWPPAETLDEETSPAPVYDEWGLPVVDGPAVANELDLPPEGVPSPVYPEEPMEEETPAGAPIVGETDGADLPPLTTDEWAMPSAEDITVGEPEAITWGVETVEVAEPVVDTPDLAGLQVSDETPYYEAPPVTDEVAYETPAAVEETPYFEAPPVTDGVAYEMPAAVEETPYFEAPPATDGVAYEMPAAVEETPYFEAPPATDGVAYEMPAAVEETPYFEAPPATDGVAYEMPAAVEETPYFEAPPATEEVAYVAMPPVTGEIPDLTIQPIQPEEVVPSVEPPLEQMLPQEGEFGAPPAYGEPQAPPEPPVPLEAVPSFDALLSPPTEGGPVEGPAFTGEIPDLSVQPVSGEFFSPLAVPEHVDESAVPDLEPEALTAPAMDEAVIPDMPPPIYDVPDLPPPTVPAYGVDGYGAEGVIAEPYGGEGYGTAALGYSPDEFAKPYGWEGAGASALAASEVEQYQGGYSPEAFVPTAPVLPDGSEAEMTSAVFSEFSSLATERPKVVRTKAGLQRRTKSEEEAVPPPTDEIEIKPITRDPEAVRSSFSNFHSATNRARDAGDSGPDVRGIDPNEVTP